MKKVFQLTALCGLALGLAVSCKETPPPDPTPKQAPPTDLKVGELTTTTADLSWTAAAEAEAYNVQVGDKAAVRVTDTSYPAKDLTLGTAYTWKVQAVKGEITSAWVDGPGFTTLAEDLPTPVPTGLTATEVTHETALLSWQHADADRHEVVVGDGEAAETTTLSYQVTGLAAETTYTWKVRSCKNNVWSEWANGPEFKTEAAPVAPIEFIQVYDWYYYGDYMGPGTSNFSVVLISFDLGGTLTGQYLELDIISTAVDQSSDRQYLDIPPGTYTFSSTEAPNNILIGDYTRFSEIEDGYFTTDYTITGGTMTVAGDHTNYTLTFNIVTAEGTFTATYTGAIMIENPDYVSTAVIDLGIMPSMSQCGYNADPWTSGVDVWLISAYKDLTLADGKFQGNGWLYRLQTHVPTGLSTTVMPDGTYNIDRTNAAWTAFGGNGTNGMVAHRLENSSLVESVWFVSGSAVSTYAGGKYKIDINAVDPYGAVIKLSIQAPPPAAAPSMMPSNQDFWRSFALTGVQKAGAVVKTRSGNSLRAR